MLPPFSGLLSPRATLQGIKTKPRWLAAFLILATVSTVAYALKHPFLVQATLAHLPHSATIEDKGIMAETLRNELPLRCMFLPIRLLVGWSSFALVLFLVTRASAPPEPVHFVNVFALEVHCEVCTVLAEIGTLALLTAGDAGLMKTPGLAPLSAAMLVQPDSLESFTLLNSLNVFTLLYIALLTYGIVLLCGCSRWKSIFAVLLTMSAYTLFAISVLRVMRDTLHLLI